MDYFVVGLLVMVMGGVVDVFVDVGVFVDDYEGEVVEIVGEIIELIEMCVWFVVVQDGGDIVFYWFELEFGIVYLLMCGVCVGCLFLMFMLKQGIENMLKVYVFEVIVVEVVFQLCLVCLIFLCLMCYVVV